MKVHRIKSISEFHKFRGLPKPEHPLISVVDYSQIYTEPNDGIDNLTFDYYSIALKRGVNKMYYGQQLCDFDEGVLFFMSPDQVLKIINNSNETITRTGWLLLIHPDFLWNSPLAKNIKHYGYFDYAVNEALFLSDKEESILTDLVKNIDSELKNNLDNFSDQVILAQLELLLTYADRFYHRQFITRKVNNHSVLVQLETLLYEYYKNGQSIKKDIPTVKYVADQLHISPNYLSRLLQTLAGKSTKHFIQDKLIDLAKEKLSTTELTVSEIAYDLGFEHSQSFSKLFKSKVGQSPVEFRASFN